MKILMCAVVLFCVSISALAESHDIERNKKLVTRFYTDVLLYKKASVIDDYIGDVYIQHNPRVPDGKDALRTFIERSSPRTEEQGPDGEIIRVIAENDLVVLHVKLTNPTKNDIAIIEIFRVEGEKIVEHWDVIQKVPSESKNNNTMF